jgi:hypothetical protein
MRAAQPNRSLERFLEKRALVGSIRAFLCGGLLLTEACVGLGLARADSAAVRWAPSAAGSVTGYNVYTRLQDGAYGAPQDAGLPAPGTGGTLSFNVAGLNAGDAYVFAVTAYEADGTESVRSNELALAPRVTTSTTTSTTTTTTTTTTSTSRASTTLANTSTTSTTSTIRTSTTYTTTTTTTSTTLRRGKGKGPKGRGTTTTSTTLPPAAPLIPCGSDDDCAGPCLEGGRCELGLCAGSPVACPAAGPCGNAICDLVTGCTTEPVLNGTACATSDPCVPGVCIDGSCSPEAALDNDTHGLTVHRLILKGLGKGLGRRGRMIAQATLAAPAGLDPAASGFVIELRARDGRLLFQAAAPAASLRRQGSAIGSRFVVRSALQAVRASGLRRLVLDLAGGAVNLLAVASSPDLAQVAGEPAVGLVVRLGTACSRDLELLCSPGPGGPVWCN